MSWEMSQPPEIQGVKISVLKAVFVIIMARVLFLISIIQSKKDGNYLGNVFIGGWKNITFLVWRIFENQRILNGSEIE